MPRPIDYEPHSVATHQPLPTTALPPDPSQSLPTTSAIPEIPTSFQDLSTHLSGIIYGAWLKSTEKISATSTNLGNVNILIGPNTTPAVKNILDPISLASRLYGNFDQIKNLYVVDYSYPDASWAQATYEKYMDHNWGNAEFHSSQTCPNVTCDGADAHATLDYQTGIINIGESQNWNNSGRPNPANVAGQVYAHEYAHTIQFFNAPNRYWFAPNWLSEGQATFAELATAGHASYTTYTASRIRPLMDQYQKVDLYTADWLTTFLNPNPVFDTNSDPWIYWNNYPRWDRYAIGFMVNEIFSALKGPDAAMNIYKDVGTGMSFVDSFNKQFGMEWADALPYISKAIALELSTRTQS